MPATAMRYNSLSDIRVVDLTHFIAGPYATKLLADYGAEVIKVEPPWGEGGRRLGPFRANRPARDRGGLFAFLNTNKLGITLNLKHQSGRDALLGLLRDADLLVENFAPGTLDKLGLRSDDLLAQFPRLSIISISNFGQNGPDRDAVLNDLTLFARGGWTYPVGEPDREPLTPPGSLAQYIGGLYGAIAAMQATLACDVAQRGGQQVDISLLEAAVATMIYETVTFQYSGIVRERAGKRFAMGPFLIVTLKCRDGYAGLQCVTDKQFEALCGLMGAPELARDERFASALARMVNNNALLEIVERFFLGHDRAWLYREGQGRAIPIVPIPSVAEVLEWEQTKARGFFETIDDPELGAIRIPGAPLRFSSHQPEPSRPAPRLGEHNLAILGARLGLGSAEIERMRGAGTIVGSL
ncbi:MAG: CaiB/BaiF CoA transferase family protein [Candidatus Binataceae bacterium]